MGLTFCCLGKKVIIIFMHFVYTELPAMKSEQWVISDISKLVFGIVDMIFNDSVLYNSEQNLAAISELATKVSNL